MRFRVSPCLIKILDTKMGYNSRYQQQQQQHHRTSEPDEDKMCSCWEGSLVSFWSRSCRDETVVEASKGAKPVRSHPRPESPAVNNLKKTLSGQQTLSDVSKDVSALSATNLQTELCQNSNVRVFTYNELKAATRNFRPDSTLGQGGFGVVYKGWIDDVDGTGVKVVAVKVLNQDGLQGHREWMAEVNYLGQLHHEHLVKLMGYACEDEHRLLVYEYMAKGSLENHLFRKTTLPLSWSTRMSIALGAAKGLAFLHGSERPVIYRDFKTSNILLDSEYAAKLSDFGLAKDGPEGDQTHVSTRIMGTYGYAAPEYVMTGHLTARSDVYSFGVVLLELLTGRRSMDKKRPAGEHNLVEWARPYLRDKRKLLQIVDPRLEGQYSVRGLQKAASLAYHCLSQNPKARPLMSDVVETLEPLQNMRDMANASYIYVAGNGSETQNHQSVKSNDAPNNQSVKPNDASNNPSAKPTDALNNQPVKSNDASNHPSLKTDRARLAPATQNHQVLKPNDVPNHKVSPSAQSLKSNDAPSNQLSPFTLSSKPNDTPNHGLSPVIQSLKTNDAVSNRLLISAQSPQSVKPPSARNHQSLRLHDVLRHGHGLQTDQIRITKDTLGVS